MAKTPLYGLNKPGYDEAADIEVLNENADIVDSALGELSAGMGDSSTLLTEGKTLTGAVNELFIGVGDGKNAVAAAITDMGQAAAGSDTFSDLSTKIRAISSDADAGTSNVLSGKTFYQGGSKKVGTMPNQGGKIIVPGTTNQPIDAGYHDGSGYVEGDADLISANIKTGVNIFGVTGSYEGAGGEYGTATPSEVLEGYTLGTESGIVPGTMPNQGATNHSLPVNGSYTIPAGYHNGSGKVTQSIATKGAQTYTPGTANQTIAAGQYLTGIQTIKGDANLVAGNIKNGISIFGVNGSAVVGLTPGDAILVSHNSEKGVTWGNAIYEKRKEIMVQKEGTYRIRFNLKLNYVTDTEKAYGRIYINDSPLGIERVTSQTSYVDYVEDIYVPAGGLVQLYLKPIGMCSAINGVLSLGIDASTQINL